MNTYKVVLVGDGGVGKTTFVKRHLENVFEQKYIATLGIEVHPLRKDNVCFNLWDCAGQEKFGGLREGYYIESSAAIFFFDLTSKISLRNLSTWALNCKRVTGNIPCVIVGTKCDIATIKDEEVLEIIGNVPYVKISSRRNHNLEEPFDILKKLLN